MTDTPMPDPSAPPAPPTPGLLARAIGVITSPGATFVHVVRTPKVAGALFLTALTIALATSLPLFTERGREAMLDLLAAQGQSPAQLQVVENLANRGFLGLIAFVNQMIFLPFAAVVTSGIVWLVFNIVSGGTATFKQVMSVVVHSQIVWSLGALFAAPIMYARGAMTGGVANLSALVPMLSETSFISKFLGMIDLFQVWWVAVLAIGIATLYKKKTSSIATGLFAFYGLVAVAVAYFTAG